MSLPLPRRNHKSGPDPRAASARADEHGLTLADVRRAMREHERRFVVETLDRNLWNIHATARALGIERTLVYGLCRSLGIEIPRDRPRAPRTPRASRAGAL